MTITGLSIKTKLTMISLTASVVVLLAFGVIIYLYAAHTTLSEKENLLRQQSQVVANNLTAAVSFQDLDAIKEAITFFASDKDFINVKVFDSLGNLILSLPEKESENQNSIDNFWEVSPEQIFRNKSHFDLKTDIVVNNSVIGHIILKSSYASVHQKINNFAVTLLFSLGISILLATLISFRLQGIITSPLSRLMNFIREVSSSKDYSLTVSNLGNDEIGLLGNSFNSMLSEINQRDLTLRLSNLSLEGRVQERTSELEATVAKLNQAQEAILTKHKQLHSVIAGAPIAMAMLDEELNLLVCSLKWVIEYNKKGESDNSFKVLNPSSFPKTWSSALTEALNGETISNSEDYFQKDDGSKIYLRWTIQPWWKDDGSVGGAIIASENISDLVHARNEALKMAQTKSQFLANVSHELRTPLNGILGFANILQESNCNKEQQEYVDLIKSSGEMLLRVINDLLDFSKLEKGATQIESLSFSPQSLIEDLARLFSISSKHKNIDLSIQIDPKIPQRVLGDEFRIKQVMANLIGNAVKFTVKGQVCVSLKLINDSELYSQLNFSVKDSGIGIPSDKLGWIFKPFSQADGTVTRRFGGTGLGLAIASELVALMGGKLEVTSNFGEGSEFYFSLELKKDQQRQQAIAEDNSILKATYDLQNKRVLVAEDNQINQKLIARMLEKAGYQVQIVEDGAQAVDSFRKSKFDIVILDLQMPNMGGLEAAIEIRKLKEMGGSTIPIVALTAHAFDEDRQKCAEVGMNDFLIKPIDKNLLLKTLINLPSLERNKEDAVR